MPKDCEIGFLDADDVARAFAVMQVVMPSLSFETWKRLLATESLRRQWAVARDRRGYIRGLVRIQPTSQGQVARILDVPIFATVSLLDQDGISRQLLDFAKKCAWEEGCEAIRFWNSAPETPEQLELPEATDPPVSLFYDLRTDRQWPEPYDTRPVKT